jgi:predicted Zn-dependent protease
MRKASGLLFFVSLQLVLVLVASRPLRAYYTAKTISAVDGSIVARKWISSAFPITWQMYPTVASNFTGSRQVSDVLTTSFGAWAAVVPVSVTQGANTATTVKAGQYDGINVITMNAAATDLPAGVLAITYTFVFTQPGTDNLNRIISFPGQIEEADMAFAPSFTFTTNTSVTSNQIDLQSVATHEAGHFFGLDHASDTSSTMFWTTDYGSSYQRNLSSDDIIGISTLYPPATFASKGTLTGTVRSTANVPIYGAIVVAVNASGAPVASTVSDPNGAYTIQGLDPGNYTVYAEPLSGRIRLQNISTLSAIYPNSTVNTNFTTRYH